MNDKNIILAKLLGLEQKYYLIRRGYYFRPNAAGYTAIPSEAGLYTEEETKLFVNFLDNEPVTSALAPFPNFINDLDEVRKIEMTLEGNNWYSYVRELHRSTNGKGEIASAEQRTDTLIKLFKGELTQKEDSPKETETVIGYIKRNNGIKGPGFKEWEEPVYSKRAGDHSIFGPAGSNNLNYRGL